MLVMLVTVIFCCILLVSYSLYTLLLPTLFKFNRQVFKKVVRKFYRNNIKRFYQKTDKKRKKKNHRGTFREHLPGKIILADTVQECENSVQLIQKFSKDGVFGFDSEWTNEGPVSLIQVAAHNGFSGMCVLFCLGKIGFVPPKLKAFLSQRNMLKLGVAPFEDGTRISKDYGCSVLGALDLRTLAHHLNLECSKGLATICMEFLGIQMDKTVRVSDWNAETLTDLQIDYAAFDAYVAILIYHKMLQLVAQKQSFFESIVMKIMNIRNPDPDEKAHNLPRGVIDKRYKMVSMKNKVDQIEVLKPKERTKPTSKSARNCKLSSTVTKPLYDNCYMQAPDGEMLCSLDRRKASWYVSKDLGCVVKEEPFTVRLNFEPSGRAVGEVGQYYIQKQVHQCVVCGSKQNYVRKNVIPKEYRKHFPAVMKVHQSHDVLLLCQRCHALSNIRDIEMRLRLASICDAPIQKKAAQKSSYSKRAKEVVKVLRNSEVSPEMRKKLEVHLMEMTGFSVVTSEIIESLHEQHKKEPESCSDKPHGLKVVEFFKKKGTGLTELEKLWRIHFLDTMEPQFLPAFWSINHNHERLTIRKTENRIDPRDAEVAGL